MFPDKTLTRRVAILTGRRLVPLPLAWEDASNWCWKSESLAPELIKLARTSVEVPFWSGIRALFGFERWEQAEQLPLLAGALPPQLPLMPLPLTFLGRLQGAPIWSLPWRSADEARWSTDFAARLGHQVGILHRESFGRFGHPLSGGRPLDEWPERVAAILTATDNTELRRLGRTPVPIPDRTVWCLPDLRPDQFLESATDGFWTDWEALVQAPPEFDWILIELLLSEDEHRQAFCAAYRQYAEIPAVQWHRLHYRGVLWCLEVFGAMPWEALRNCPNWLDMYLQ